MRKRYIFHGKVQGVGFRAFCAHAAAAVRARGWVRNRPDGTVEMEAEGPPDVLEDLLARIRRGGPLIRVDRVEALEATPRRDEAEGFDVTD